MSAETKPQGWEFEVTETDDGFRIEIKGDKEALRARVEAIKAFFEFAAKARQAGWDWECGPPFGFHAPFWHGRMHWHGHRAKCCW